MASILTAHQSSIKESSLRLGRSEVTEASHTGADKTAMLCLTMGESRPQHPMIGWFTVTGLLPPLGITPSPRPPEEDGLMEELWPDLIASCD
ncbi:hypothetical protein ElyMa_005400200 [Elysia marginata]|uniref:Uncharacterized protein n=1 Tax=Elysia marginata TaxID=1093978 RepID=A0AAV4EHD2_9GAST|nr:hypothetical protein ElyMa_005400200 [Elysia marginata]